MKVGDKVSKDDLILTISSGGSTPSISKDVPKNTENLIEEAETHLKKSEQNLKEIMIK